MKVLIALDGSARAQEAVAMVGQLFSGKDTATTLIYVLPHHHVFGRSEPVAEPHDQDERLREAEEFLRATTVELRQAGVGPAITTETKVGDPAEVIIDTAAHLRTDLIVVGSRGLNAAQRFLLGSVSQKVVSHAPCPVLVVHPRQYATG